MVKEPIPQNTTFIHLSDDLSGLELFYLDTLTRALTSIADDGLVFKYATCRAAEPENPEDPVVMNVYLNEEEFRENLRNLFVKIVQEYERPDDILELAIIPD